MARKKSPTAGASSNDEAAPPASPAAGNNTLALAAAAQLLQHAQAQQQSTPGGATTTTPVTSPQPTATQPAQQATAATAETLHTLASIMNSNAAQVAAAANKHLLPNSAPVSSLLPPVPALPTGAAAAAAPHVAAAAAVPQPISSQIAALLSGAAAPPSATPQPRPTFATAPQPPQAPPAPPAATSLLRHTSAGNPHAAVAAAAVQAAAVPSALVPNMQNWSLEQLQQHAKLLEQLKQPIPQTVSLLLADAKRKEEKRNAKRIANRKSASTSRARKKAYVQEMTELNARLKRQALILSLLPDMVIVIGVEGNISFCSAQVERVLRYDAEELVGVNLTQLLVPASKDKLNRLIKQLLKTERKGSEDRDEEDNKEGASASEAAGAAAANASEGDNSNNDAAMQGGVSSGAENSATDGGAAVVSEPSFPLSVVQVEAKRNKAETKRNRAGPEEQATNDNSDMSTNPEKVSSLTASHSGRSGVFMVNNGSGSSDNDNDKKKQATGDNTKGNSSPKAAGAGGDRKSQTSSDISNSSSLSTNAKNVQQANTNLERNVRIANKKLKTESKRGAFLYKDDVTGADVTANNATARLSSLQHRPESTSSEEDSGYRESNDSREETSSSVSDSSDSNGRPKPIAPTCNVCLIRKDLTTIWCEVTSSIRTKEPEEDTPESISDTPSNNKKTKPSGTKTPPPRSKSPGEADMQAVAAAAEEKPKEPEQEVQKELLLCLRPVRDGDQKIHEKLRFESGAPAKKHKKKRPAPDSAWSTTSSKKGKSPSPTAAAAAVSEGVTSSSPSSRPFKKRGLGEVSKSTTTTTTVEGSKESSGGDSGALGADTDAAESLMLMTKKATG